MDGRDARAGVLCLRRQLSDRREVRRHYGCRSVARDPPSGGRRGEDHDRAHRGALRYQARAARGRYGLRFGGEPQLARQGQENRAAHPGDRQRLPSIGWTRPAQIRVDLKRSVAPRGVIASQQPIPAASRDIDLMEAASLRAMRSAITTTQAFEMQNKHPRILKITGEFVLRPWGGAYMP